MTNRIGTLALLLAAGAICHGQYVEQRSIRGAWYRGPSTISALRTTLNQMAYAGITDLYLETFYHGVTLSENGTFQRRYSFDYLSQAIPEAAKVGIRVHCWVEAAYWQYGTTGAYLFAANPEYRAINVSTGTYGGDATDQVFANLAIPGVRAKLQAYCQEIAAYPGVWGVQTDYHRYPLDNNTGDSYKSPWSYDTVTQDLYRTYKGDNSINISTQAAKSSQQYYSNFLQWRRDQISQAANQMRQGVQAGNSDVVFSAAVFPSPLNSAQESKCQDWGKWVTNNYVDHVMPMCYSSTTASIQSEIEAAQLISGSKRLVPGLYPYSSASHPVMTDQLNVLKSLGIEDFAGFYGTTFASTSEQIALRNWIAANAKRIRGDLDNDDKLEWSDWTSFWSTYRGVPVSATLNPRLDYDGNGTIDTTDHNRFRAAMRNWFLGEPGSMQPSDWTAFNTAYTGPGPGTAGTYVNLYDVDRDGDVDGDDQRMFGLIGATTPMAFVTVSLQDLATPATAVGKSVSYQFRLAGNPTILGSGTAPIDSQNQIIIPTPSGSGAYELYVSGSHWLRKMVPFNLGTTDVAGLNLSLINGDVVQDNLINTDDYLALSGAFDTVPSDPSWNANADLDENGIINSDDYLILSFNFDTSGD